MANPYPALITDANSETRIAGSINFTDASNQPGTAAVFARVHCSSVANNWDGNSFPNAVVDYDPAGLWDALNAQFVIVTAGWYSARLYGTNNGVLSVNLSTGSVGVLSILNSGAGDNIAVEEFAPTGDTNFLQYPWLFGTVHCAAADTLSISAGGGTGWKFYGGAAFEIQLVV